MVVVFYFLKTRNDKIGWFALCPLGLSPSLQSGLSQELFSGMTEGLVATDK